MIKYCCRFCEKEYDNQTDAINHEKEHLEKELMTLQEAIERMENAVANNDLSDLYLLKHNEKTRCEVFGGDYVYGMAMVPASFALILAKRLLQETKNEEEVIPYSR